MRLLSGKVVAPRSLCPARAVLVIATLAASLPPHAAAATVTLKNVSIEPPVGWVRSDLNGAAIWRTGEGATSCALSARPPRDATDPTADFEAEWQAGLAWVRVTHGKHGPAPVIQALDDGLTLAFGSAGSRTSGGGIRFLGVAVATRGGTRQPFLLAGTDERCQPAFFAFLSHIKPHGAAIAAAPSVAAVRSSAENRIAGLWIGMNTVSSVGMIGGWPTAPQYTYQTGPARWSMLFLPDGRYVRELPDGGIDEITLGRVPPERRGTYRFDGATVLLTDGRGAVERMDYRDGKLSNGSGSLDVRSMLINRTPLSGRYSAQSDPARWRGDRFNAGQT